MLIGLVLYDGVLREECESFESVLSRVTGAEFTTVATSAGSVRGPGGQQIASLSFDEFIDDPHPLEVIVVPGGIGCERAADDPDFVRFLHVMGERARLIAASSTGSVILAGAGLLHGRPAATHWLAESLLRKYGSEVDRHRLAIHGNVVTCEGRLSALDAAFAIVERIENPKAVERIRSELLEANAPLVEAPSWWRRILRRFVDRIDRRQQQAGTPPSSVMIELVDDPELAARIRSNSARRESGWR